MTQTNQLNKRLKQLDIQPYSIQLNYKNKLDFTSTTGGFISLIFYLAAIAVITVNAVNFFNQTLFIFDQYLIKNDLDVITLRREWFGLLITGGNDTHIFNITAQTQHEYGIQVWTEKADQPNAQDLNKKLAVVCDHQSLLNQSNLTDLYCFPKGFNLSISGRSDVFTKAPYHRLGWVVKNTSTSSNKTVKNLKNLTAIFYFVNNVTNPKKKQVIVDTKIRKFYIRDGFSLVQDQIQQLTLYFQKLLVRTDNGLFYQDQNIQQSSFYDEEFFTTTLSNNDQNDDRLIWIKMKRSLFTVQYERHYKKLSTFLAQTLGLIGLISLIFIIYKGYNKWCFTQTELVHPSYRQKTNIFKYYYHMLRNLKHITKSSQLYDEFQHNLDIHKILSKLDDYQQRLRKLEGKSEVIYEEGYQPQYAIKKDNRNGKKQHDKQSNEASAIKKDKKKQINQSESSQGLLSPKKR